MSYLPHTLDDLRIMLATIGVKDIESLFSEIPEDCRLRRPLDIAGPLDEISLTAHMEMLASGTISTSQAACFLGGGAYDHFVPAVVDHLASRGEFYTSYTPYQAEASQGNLQVYFEYQSLVANLTGMEVSNMSLYDGGSAAAEAVLMSLSVSSKRRVVISSTVHPEYREVVKTYCANLGVEIVTVSSNNGVVDPQELQKIVDGDTACVLLQQPNFFGSIERLEELTSIAHAAGAIVAVSVDPVSLGILKRPGDCGVDLVIAEGQCLGNHLAYGGPYLGILACRESFVRRMPGRLAGQTTDRRGNRCWVLTLQTREQHIRREKATSNVCTNQGLLALRSAIHLAVLGPEGLREVAESCLAKAAYAKQRLTATARLTSAFDSAFFKEFVVRDACGAPGSLVADLLDAGYLAGVPLGQWYPELDDCLLVAVTEKRTRTQIDGLAAAVDFISTSKVSHARHAVHEASV